MNSLEIKDISDSYRSIAAPTEGSYRELGSRFLSFAYPITSEEEAKSHLETLKQKYHNARHICYAYRLGREGEIWRVNDDGEPSSSAGKPIYGQLLSFDVSDILVAVVRYFGGTKLGIPGLIRAYRSATKEAIENGTIIEKVELMYSTITFNYPLMEEVMRIVKQREVEIMEQKFDNNCTITFATPKSLTQAIEKSLSQIEGVKFTSSSSQHTDNQ